MSADIHQNGCHLLLLISQNLRKQKYKKSQYKTLFLINKFFYRKKSCVKGNLQAAKTIKLFFLA
ncbi:MAG: hypothetical protein J5725_02760, partial [Bacteroidales bacterium]|nr:hypothetical protein [Bacteroidales bacterium]